MDRELSVCCLLQMIDRTVAGAKTRPGSNGFLHEIMRPLDSVAERHACAEAASNRGGERAARAVRVSRRNSFGDVGARTFVTREQQIAHRFACAVTALDENRPRAQ